MSPIITFILAIIGAVCGIIGAILGVINTCHSLSQSKVKLKVIPKRYFLTGGGEGLCIDIINLSTFQVTINDAGFFLNDVRGRRASYPRINLNTLPHKLETRESISVYFPSENLDANLIKNLTDAYSMTACGTTVKGTSPALKQIIKNGAFTIS